MSDILSFIRESWNQNLSTQDFMIKMHEIYDKNGINEIASHLLEMCGMGLLNPKFLFNCLVAIIQEDPSYIFQWIPTIQSHSEKIDPYIKLFHDCGDTLCNNLTVGEKDSADYALNILKFVLSFQTDIEAIISKLTNSPKFSTLIASGRVLSRDNFLETRSLFLDIDPYNNNSYNSEGEYETIPLTQIHFFHALFSRNLNYTQILHTQHDEIHFFASTILSWKSKNIFFSFIHRSISYILYHIFINHFISKPSLHLGFLITNLIVRVLNKDYDDDNGNHEFNEDPVLQTLSKMNDASKRFFDGSNLNVRNQKYLSVNQKMEFWEFFPNERNIEDYKILLTSKPPQIVNADLFSIALKYPMIISKIVNLIIDAFNENDEQAALEFAENIFSRLKDFHHLLCIQKKLTEFFISLTNFLLIREDEHSFTQFWILLLSLFDYSWKSGSPILRSYCISFLNNTEPLLSFYLIFYYGCNHSDDEKLNNDFNFSLDLNFYMNKYQITRNIDKLKDDFKYENYYFKNVFSCLFYLIETQNIDEIFDIISNKIYLLPSALWWGIKSKNHASMKLIELPIPRYKFIQKLFSQLIITLTKPKSAWEIFADLNNYDVILENRPKNISLILHRIISDVNRLTKGQIDNIKVFYSIATLWRSWIKIFSLNVFVSSLLSLLVLNSKNSTNIIYNIKAFIASASVICTAVEENSDMLYETMKIVIACLDDENQNVTGSVGLANFFSVILLSLHERSNEAIELLDDIKAFTSKNDISKNSPRMAFITVISTISLYHFNFHSLMTPDMFNLNFLKSNCQLAIDYYISQEIEKERENI
ncbi:hypothetical protein TRFO_29244 [Tritrichomonas foetus]|uniref:Uncharacterized protein n=1 Tax=Tritrichomonas foetus TaxID=1144522 RepID=A0A1J4JXI2_9EUKA|nr:hypothetical protein TRFO_29244 [Tritrichomonas foetus]|eukprot:OHT03378.1 hypothetical protein TRFO_29244 [Tritrichomonas foetus]